MSFSSLGALAQQGLNIASSISPGDVLTKLPSGDQVAQQALLMAEWVKHPGEIQELCRLG